MNDIKTITAIRNKDEAVFENVIERYSKLLWKISSAVLSNAGTEQDIEECVADAFIYLWRNSESFDPQKGRLKTWLSVVARSKALDKYRSIQKNQSIPLNDDFEEYIGESDTVKEENAELNNAVLNLPHTDREILLRRYYHEQKPKEIALALNMTVKQVDNSLYRSKQKLRRRLKE